MIGIMGMPHDLNLIINRMKIVILFNDEKCIIVDMAKFSEKKKVYMTFMEEDSIVGTL